MSHLKKVSTAILVSTLVFVGYAHLSRAADPKITVEPSNTTFLPGETVTYKVTITNDTPDPIDNAKYRFYLKDAPASITGSTIGSPINGVDSEGSFIQTSTPQSLVIDGTATYEVTVEIPLEYAGTAFKTTAEILNGDGEVTENKSTTLNLRVPILTITKTGLATVQRGATIDYAIQVTNKGYADALNVKITDTPPSYLTYVSAPGSTDCALTAEGSRSVVCGPLTLEPNKSHTVILRFQTDSLTPCGTAQTNQADVIADTLEKKIASATTNILCSTPTPSPTIKPTTTPTPQIIYVEKNNDDKSDENTPSSESKPAPKPKGQVKGIRRVVHTAAQQKEAGYIPFHKAPLAVDLVFGAAFHKKPAPLESTYWKNRARTDKYTTRKLYQTMLWYKGKGITHPKNILAKTTAAISKL